MPLFERHARGVRLTVDGQRFVIQVEQAFGIIDSAANQWRSPRTPLALAYLERSGLVRVSRRQVASPLRHYFNHAKGENRPEVLALIERMRRA